MFGLPGDNYVQNQHLVMKYTYIKVVRKSYLPTKAYRVG